jgi:hypothetical protein
MIQLFRELIPNANAQFRLRPHLPLYPSVYPLGIIRLMTGDIDELDGDSELVLDDGFTFEDGFDLLETVSF